MQQLQEDQQQIQYQRHSLKNIVKTFSWLLVLFCLSLFTAVVYSFVYDGVMLHHLVYKNIYLTCALLIFGLLIAFNVLLNYFFAIKIPPGVTSDFFFSTIQPQDLEQAISQRTSPFHYDPSKSQFNKSNLTIPLDNSTLGFCGKCQLPKPYRSHHCSICEKCVLKMDHHCPWINNCVGHQNHRHFLLFLTYVFIGTLYFSILNIHIKLSDDFKPYKHHQTQLFSVLWLFDIAILTMMISFGTWNWFLALKGYTAIEFINKDRKTTFQQGIRDNLKQIFGQFNHIFEIFLPSLRELPSNGVIWVKIEEQARINTATD